MKNTTKYEVDFYYVWPKENAGWDHVRTFRNLQALDKFVAKSKRDNWVRVRMITTEVIAIYKD